MHKKHLLMAFAVLILSWLPADLHAQDSEGDAWYYNKQIRSIDFTGLSNIKKSDLEGITSSFVGRAFTDDVIVDLYDRMFALDYFDDVNIKASRGNDGGKTVRLTLEVTERPIISRIIFKGNRQLHNSELKDAISIKEKDIFVQSKLLADERALRNHYIDKGYSSATVTSVAEQTDNGYYVTFEINEGRQTVVRSIQFGGNQVVASNTLKRKISLKEMSLFNAGSFQESSIEADKKAIVTYYQDRGYADARVLGVSQESSFNEEKNREELTITFEIHEGSLYTFGGLTFSGNKVFSDERLDSLVKLRPGRTYNETAFQESVMAVQNLYFENGYTSNNFNVQMSMRDTDNKVLAYIMYISENPRSHVEDIIIKGNTKTKEFVIRREIPIDTGDIFSNAKITNAMRNLYNLQYFSAVVPQVTAGSEDGLVNIVFEVEEQSTTTLDFGFTFSGVTDPDAFPIALYLKIQDSNLFGEGRAISAGTTLSTDEQSISLNYGQNWLLGLPVSLSTTLSYTHSSNNYALRNKLLPDGSVDSTNYYLQYEQHSFSLSESVGRRWTPDFAILTLTGGISGSLINNIYDDHAYIPYDQSITQYANSWEPKNSLWASFSMDGRNINYDPSTGWFLSQRVAWYGLLPQGSINSTFGETEFYLRTDTKLERYFTLVNKPVSENWAFKLIIMGYSGLSLQFPIPGTSIKQSNQLYIDGMFNGRGWTIYNTVAGRGKAMWSNTLELRMPVVPGVLAIDLFADAICVKDDAFGDGNAFFGGSLFRDIDDWYFSYGPSIRFCIQQFPLRLLFVSTFKFNDGAFCWMDQYANVLSDSNGWKNFWSSWHFVLSFNMTNR